MSQHLTPEELGELVARGELSEGEAAERMAQQVREDAFSSFYAGRSPEDVLQGKTPSVESGQPDPQRLADIQAGSDWTLVLAAVLGTALLLAVLYLLF